MWLFKKKPGDNAQSTDDDRPRTPPDLDFMPRDLDAIAREKELEAQKLQIDTASIFDNDNASLSSEAIAVKINSVELPAPVPVAEESSSPSETPSETPLFQADTPSAEATVVESTEPPVGNTIIAIKDDDNALPISESSEIPRDGPDANHIEATPVEPVMSDKCAESGVSDSDSGCQGSPAAFPDSEQDKQDHVEALHPQSPTSQKSSETFKKAEKEDEPVRELLQESITTVASHRYSTQTNPELSSGSRISFALPAESISRAPSPTQHAAATPPSSKSDLDFGSPKSRRQTRERSQQFAVNRAKRSATESFVLTSKKSGKDREGRGKSRHRTTSSEYQSGKVEEALAAVEPVHEQLLVKMAFAEQQKWITVQQKTFTKW
jgi:hypothetical protein